MAPVEVREIVKQFGENPPAVDHISLTAGDGEFLVLLGPSGCGKTTLLRMIGGLEPPTGGDVLIGGHIVTHLPPRARRIAMVFQSYALYPHMSVYDNISFPLKAQRMPKEEQKTRDRMGSVDFGSRRSAGAQTTAAFRRSASAGGVGQSACARTKRLSS